jgi:hypothetical protein
MSIFRGGIPYGMDVNRLKEAFPVPTLVEGRVINHSELQEVLSNPSTSRYYCVVNSWRREMKNMNAVHIVWESKIGLKILDPAQLYGHTKKGIKQKFRQVGRKLKALDWVDRKRLNPVGQQAFDHDIQVRSKVAAALESANKDLAVDLAPVKSLPKPKIVPGEKGMTAAE